MTIDDMKVGQVYTIRYRVGESVEEFRGCRFEGIALHWWDQAEPELRGVVVYRAKTTPMMEYFSEGRIVDIEPE